MILLCNGDSWTQGDSPAQTINWDSNESLDWYNIPHNFGNYHIPSKAQQFKFYDSEVWPKVLGRNLKVKTINAGRLGDDNQGITRRTIYLVEKYTALYDPSKILVVIGWSSCLREPVFKIDKKNKINLSQIRPANHLQNTLPSPIVYTDKFALTVYTLQSYLESKKIKFLFFNAFDNFSYKESNFKYLIKTKYWLNNDPEISHFYSYLKEKYNIKHIGEESENMISAHPTDKAHTEWGEYLTKYIKDNYELN